MNITWPDTRGDWDTWSKELHIDELEAAVEAEELNRARTWPARGIAVLDDPWRGYWDEYFDPDEDIRRQG